MARATMREHAVAGLLAVSVDVSEGSSGLRAERPRLLFLHGAFATHACFVPWMERLAAQGWASTAISFRGRLGVGPEHAEGLRMADYVADAISAVDALGGPPVLVGHSMGGLVAQKVAESSRAAGLVLLAPAPAAMLDAQPVAVPALAPMVPRILMGRPLLPPCSTCERIVLHRMPKADRKRIHGSLVHESGAAYRDMIFGTVRVDPARVRSPVLVLGGREDRVVSEKQLRFTATRYGGELDLLEQHAHWLLEEPGWESIVDRMARWLTQQSWVARDERTAATRAAA